MDQLAAILSQTNFTALDWVIVGLYPLISVAIGLIARRYVADMGDFICAGRGVRTALGIATLTGTELGLVTVMYNAQKGFTGGFAAFHIGLVAGVTTLVVGITGFIIAALRRQEVLTIPDFYGRRFGQKTRILGGLVLALSGILNMGMFLKAGSMFIVGITGLPPGGNALMIVMLILLVLVLFYTIMGGMVSVVIADYVQFVVLSFGLLIATALAISKVGWTQVFASMSEIRGEEGFNPFVAEGTFGFDYVVWMVFLGLASCALWPTSVARALASESERVVKRQFTLASVSYAIRVIIPCFWGACAFIMIMQTPALRDAFFPEGFPPPAAAGTEALDSLYAMPMFLGRILPVGIIGIITAAMLAAFMSTHDSYFLCWSSVITNDVVGPLMGGKLSQRAEVKLTRWLIFAVGVFIFLISFLFPLREDLWDYMAITGAIYFAGTFAVLTGGLYWKRASSTGAVLATCAGCFAVFGLRGVQKGLAALIRIDPERFASFTSARVGLATIGLAVVAMVVGSLLFPDRAPAGQPIGKGE